MSVGLRRDDLGRLTLRVLRPPLDARPDVRLVEYDGIRMVVKDYASGGTRFKSALGVYLIAREHNALQRATGMRGVPHYYGRIDSFALASEYIEGVPATDAPREWLDEAFYAALESVVGELHRRGIVHCDLKKLDNILVTPEREPYVIDFTASFVAGSNPVTGLIFEQMRDDDLRGIYKLKRIRTPELLSPQEAAFLDYRSAEERGFRAIRGGIREAVQRWSAGRHQQENGVSA